MKRNQKSIKQKKLRRNYCAYLVNSPDQEHSHVKPSVKSQHGNGKYDYLNLNPNEFSNQDYINGMLAKSDGRAFKDLTDASRGWRIAKEKCERHRDRQNAKKECKNLED